MMNDWQCVFSQTWSLKAKGTPWPKYLTLKSRQKIFVLKLMYMCEPACSPLNVFWSYLSMITTFDRALLSFYGFHRNSIWPGSNSSQSVCLTFAKYQSSTLGYIQTWNTTLSRPSFRGTRAHSLKNLPKDLCSCFFWCSDLQYPSFTVFLSLHLCLSGQLFFTPRKCSWILRPTLTQPNSTKNVKYEHLEVISSVHSQSARWNDSSAQ